MNKQITILTVGLLVSFAPLFGAQSGRVYGPGTTRQMPMDQRQAPSEQQGPGVSDQEGPQPLTEEEQLALMQKMGIADQGEGNSRNTRSITSEEI